MKRIFILLFITLGFMLISQAQTTITAVGTVVCNGQPVSGTPVIIDDSLSGVLATVLTDSVGNYSYSYQSNATQGSITATAAGPGGNAASASGFYSPGRTFIQIPTIDICSTGGGGTNCQAAFSASASVFNPLMYRFSDNSSGGNPASPVTTWAWDFGDGNSSTVQNPTHTYASTGTYNVCLIITAGTCIDTACQSITIGANPCDAAFTFQTTIGGQVFFTDLSRGGIAPFTYAWDFGDGNTSTTANPTHTYNVPGPFTVCLTITDATGCVDSTCQLVTLNSAPSCQASFSPQANGLNVQFFNTSTGLGALATNTYQWDFGNGNTSTVASPTHTYTATGTYTICLILNSTLNGMTCADTSCATIILTAGGGGNRGTIEGQVLKNNVGADSVKVWLILHDSVAGTLTAIDSTITLSTPILGAGYYAFGNLPAGSYRTKAALQLGDPDYANYLPTYHDNDLNWSNASVINLTPNTPATANINMVAGVNPGGPGFIGGLISQGANKRDVGDPIEDVYVYILDNNDQAVAYDLTNADGEYEFPNLAYGTYRVHVEILGKTYTDQFITISAASSSATNVNFAVNSTSIDVTTSIDQPAFGSLTRIYPNPTKGLINLELKLEQAVSLEIELMDMLGRSFPLEQKALPTGEHKLQLNVERFSKGLYFVNIKAENQTISYKLIVE